MNKITLYHVTPIENQVSILNQGVLPSKSEGKWKASWWVTQDALDWALAHVSARRDIPTSHLIIFEVTVTTDVFDIGWKKSPWKGVFRTDVIIGVRTVQDANLYFARKMAKEEI